MNSQEIRALLFQKKLAYQDFEGSLPRLPELDGQLGVLEISAADAVQADRLATDENGEIDNSLRIAAMVIKSLVMASTKEHIFSTSDLQAVAGFGTSILKPIALQVNALSGMDSNAVEDAKKNSSTTLDSDLATPLQEISEAAPTLN